jgi:GNAT superfamily N-acetyltransferase
MITIKEMDDLCVPLYCPLGGSMLPSSPTESRSNAIRRRFFGDVRRQYGNCVFVAWDDDRIVGFLMFFPRSVAIKIGLRPMPPEGPDDRTLVLMCMQVAHGYRGKGVGTALVQSVMNWAREHGWKRIEVNRVTEGKSDADWWWSWALPKWQRIGFCVVRKEPTISVAWNAPPPGKG